MNFALSVFGFSIDPATFDLLSRMRVFITWPLKFNTPKLNVWWLVEGTVYALDFLYLHHIPVLFSVKYSFLFLKKCVTSTLDIPERQILINVTWTFWGRVTLFYLQTRRGATLCYAVARRGPREIMYRKIECTSPPPPPPPPPLINDRSLKSFWISYSQFLKCLKRIFFYV